MNDDHTKNKKGPGVVPFIIGSPPAGLMGSEAPPNASAPGIPLSWTPVASAAAAASIIWESGKGFLLVKDKVTS